MIGALNMADFPFYHNFVNIESYNSARRGILKTSPMWSGVGGFFGRIIIPTPISWICIIFIEDGSGFLNILSKYSCLCVLWWRISFWRYLFYVELKQLPWLVSLFLDIWLQLLLSINWFYFLQGMLYSMGYCFLIGKHRTVCDYHVNK